MFRGQDGQTYLGQPFYIQVDHSSNIVYWNDVHPPHSLRSARMNQSVKSGEQLLLDSNLVVYIQ